MKQPFFYLATPYSKFKPGLGAAFRMACRAAATCLKAGVPVYSPIAHMHPIALFSDLDPLDHSIWLPADRPMMDAATGMLVWMADGWSSSFGIQEEVKVFDQAGKPVIYARPSGPDFADALRIVKPFGPML